MRPRRLPALLALVALAALIAAPAAAQEEPPPEDPPPDYPPVAPQAAVDDVTPVPGEVITVAGEGWRPGTEVTATLFSEPRVLARTEVNDAGEFAVTVEIPTDVDPGRHTLRVAGVAADGEETHVDVALRVTEPAPESAPQAGMAATGMNSSLGAAVGLGLLAAGGGAVYAARRRQARLDHGA